MQKEFSKANNIILGITITILTALEIYAIKTNNGYIFDYIPLAALVFLVYKIKDRIELHPFHCALLCSVGIIHNLGMFGLYSINPFGIGFDNYIHTFFGFTFSLILFRAYDKVGPYRGWFKYIEIIGFIVAFGAFHEILEFLGSYFLGSGDGMFHFGIGDIRYGDAQRDMINNLIGIAIGLITYNIKRKFTSKAQ